MSPGGPRRPESGRPAESGEREERCRVRNTARRGSERWRPGAALRGAGGQNLHQERRGYLLSGYPLAAPRRGEAYGALPRRPPARCQILFPRSRLRCRVWQQRDLLRDTCPTRRAVDRRPGCGLAIRRRTRCPHRSLARDSRGPPGGPVDSAITARGDPGAAAVRRRPAAQLRHFLGARSRRRPFGWYPGSRRDHRNLCGREYGVASAFEIVVDDSSPPLVLHRDPVLVTRRAAREISGRLSREHASIRWAGSGSPSGVTFQGMECVYLDGRVYFGIASVVVREAR